MNVIIRIAYTVFLLAVAAMWVVLFSIIVATGPTP